MRGGGRHDQGQKLRKGKGGGGGSAKDMKGDRDRGCRHNQGLEGKMGKGNRPCGDDGNRKQDMRE